MLRTRVPTLTRLDLPTQELEATCPGWLCLRAIARVSTRKGLEMLRRKASNPPCVTTLP